MESMINIIKTNKEILNIATEEANNNSSARIDAVYQRRMGEAICTAGKSCNDDNKIRYMPDYSKYNYNTHTNGGKSKKYRKKSRKSRKSRKSKKHRKKKI